MTDLTVDSLRAAFRPLALLANAPDLDDQLVAYLGALLSSERVTRAELMAAIVDITKRQDFWPGPKALLDSVHRARQADFLARQAEETQERIRERNEAFLAIRPSAAPDEPVAPLEGLPVPPPREPRTAGEMERRNMFGPVRLPDGRLDPRWPEHEERESAWKRKMRYDHGICSYASANAPTAEEAKRLEARDRETRVPGVQRLF